MPDYDDALAEQELAEEIVSYRRKTTGVRNTVFISPRGRTRHGPRIKVAIDPPDTVDPRGAVVSVEITNGEVVAGTGIDPELLAQVREFIDLNQAALLAYWNYEISTDELAERLRPIA